MFQFSLKHKLRIMSQHATKIKVKQNLRITNNFNLFMQRNVFALIERFWKSAINEKSNWVII